MFCKNCGSQIDDNASVCIHCGASVREMQTTQQQPAQSNTLAIVGFVFAFLMPLVGLICSIIGLKKSKELSDNGKGLATAGIIISVIEILIVIIAIIAVVVPLMAALSEAGAFAFAL